MTKWRPDKNKPYRGKSDPDKGEPGFKYTYVEYRNPKTPWRTDLIRAFLGKADSFILWRRLLVCRLKMIAQSIMTKLFKWLVKPKRQ
jgi:hypothetical protein